MIELLVILTPVALLGGTIFSSLATIILFMLLTGPSLVVKPFFFIVGVFLSNLASGFLILLGLQSMLDHISAYVMQFWQSPETTELVFQILLGIVICTFGLRMHRGPSQKATKSVVSSLTTLQVFNAGVILTIVSLPGAFPYFAAIDLTMRLELNPLQQVIALSYFNMLFVMPLVSIVVLRLALGEQGQSVLDKVKYFFDTWGPRIFVILLIALGSILIIDGIGWFIGHPLIPV